MRQLVNNLQKNVFAKSAYSLILFVSSTKLVLPFKLYKFSHRNNDDCKSTSHNY